MSCSQDQEAAEKWCDTCQYSDVKDDIEGYRWAAKDAFLAGIEHGRKAERARAVEIAENFPATEEFHALDPCCFCEGVAKAIRAGERE